MADDLAQTLPDWMLRALESEKDRQLLAQFFLSFPPTVVNNHFYSIGSPAKDMMTHQKPPVHGTSVQEFLTPASSDSLNYLGDFRGHQDAFELGSETVNGSLSTYPAGVDSEPSSGHSLDNSAQPFPPASKEIVGRDSYAFVDISNAHEFPEPLSPSVFLDQIIRDEDSLTSLGPFSEGVGAMDICPPHGKLDEITTDPKLRMGEEVRAARDRAAQVISEPLTSGKVIQDDEQAGPPLVPRVAMSKTDGTELAKSAPAEEAILDAVQSIAEVGAAVTRPPASPTATETAGLTIVRKAAVNEEVVKTTDGETALAGDEAAVEPAATQTPMDFTADDASVMDTTSAITNAPIVDAEVEEAEDQTAFQIGSQRLGMNRKPHDTTKAPASGSRKRKSPLGLARPSRGCLEFPEMIPFFDLTDGDTNDHSAPTDTPSPRRAKRARFADELRVVMDDDDPFASDDDDDPFASDGDHITNIDKTATLITSAPQANGDTAKDGNHTQSGDNAPTDANGPRAKFSNVVAEDDDTAKTGASTRLSSIICVPPKEIKGYTIQHIIIKDEPYKWRANKEDWVGQNDETFSFRDLISYPEEELDDIKVEVLSSRVKDPIVLTWDGDHWGWKGIGGRNRKKYFYGFSEVRSMLVKEGSRKLKGMK